MDGISLAIIHLGISLMIKNALGKSMHLSRSSLMMFPSPIPVALESGVRL